MPWSLNKMDRGKFDYETKVWGGSKIRLSPGCLSAPRLAMSLETISYYRQGRVLDVGCGAGDYLEAMGYYRPELKRYGIDSSKKAISLAKKRGLTAVLKVADACRLPFTDNFFEIVFCVDLLEHMGKPKSVLKEIYRVLKPNGVLLLFVPVEGNLLSLEGWLIKLGWQAKIVYAGHIQHLTKKQLVIWLKEVGFKIKKIRWGEHCLYQLVEIVYFIFLSIRGKRSQRSVEGWLALSETTGLVKILRVIKTILVSLMDVESKLFRWLPGLSLHIAAVKGEVNG